MRNDYLKLGTVFKQKTEGTLPLMVVGYLPVHPDTGEMYDYMVVLYPAGMLNNYSLLMIDHEEVGEILFDGYFDQKTDEIISGLQSIEE